MRKPGLDGACWPSPVQEDVLRVVVSPLDEAVAAWRRIRPRLDVDDLWDGEVYRLLPAVAARLREAGVADPDLARMTGLHKRTWYLNQRRLHGVRPWIARLQAEGIDVLALKGLPLVLRHHPDLGLRPMSDVDLLVPSADAPRALDLLEGGGFVDRGGVDRATLFRLYHGSGLTHPDGPEIDIDLHWNLGSPFLRRGDALPGPDGPPGARSMAAFWVAAEPLDLGDEVTVSMLAPADLLLHLVVHGVWAGSGSTVRWIADLHAVLTSAAAGRTGPVDWGRFLHQTRTRGLVVPVANALRYAVDTFSLAVPPHVVTALDHECRRVPGSERRRYRRMALEIDAGPKVLGGLPHLRSYWAYTSSPWSAAERAANVGGFVADLWGERSVLAVPVGAVRRATTRLRGGGRDIAPVPGYVHEGRPPPAPPSTVSVIVPTLRRPEHLGRCLDALAAQREPADQIVVVHRLEDTETATAIAARPDAGTITVVTVDRPALVRAVHAGAGAATGAIVAFTDDDARPRPNWVEGIRRQFRTPGVGAVGGRDVISGQPDPVAHPVGPVGLVRWYGRFVGDHTRGTGGARPVHHLKGVNMAIRADLLRFPTGLRGDGAEVYNEVPMGLAVGLAHADVVYDPELLVDHDLGPRFDSDLRTAPTTAARAAAAYNQSFALFSMLPPVRARMRLLYAVLLGDRGCGGVVCCTGLRLRGDADLRGLWWPYLRATLDAWHDARRAPLRLVAAGQDLR